jgi:hypothetical protein
MIFKSIIKFIFLSRQLISLVANHLKICHMKFSSSSQYQKVSDKIFVNNKLYHDKVILIIFIL